MSRLSFYRISQIAFVALVVSGGALQLFAAPAEPPKTRLVSLSGDVTEIIYALGAEKTLVGVDTSSIYPEAATKLPQVGYQRMLSAEGVLSLHPTLVVASVDAGPPYVVQQLKQSGISWNTIPDEHTVAGTVSKIRAVASVLHCKARGEDLVAHLNAQITKAHALLASEKSKPKVLFIYARGGGTVNVAGKGTAADAMIALAGGVNAVSGYTGYKPITAEAVIAAAPDVILIPTLGLKSIGGVDGLLDQPGIAETPAGKSRKVVAMDDLLLLGFGPRLGEAVSQLADSLHDGKSDIHKDESSPAIR